MTQSSTIEHDPISKNSSLRSDKLADFGSVLKETLKKPGKGGDEKTDNLADRVGNQGGVAISSGTLPIGWGMGHSDTPLVDVLTSDGKVAFERDIRRNADDEESDKPEDQHAVSNTLEELLESDPEFKKAFDEASENGVRVNFRFNGDKNDASIVNGDVLQVDIPSDADIKSSLKKVFNKDSDWDVVKPGKGPSFDEVMKDENMPGDKFVDNMERLGIFSFSGEHGGKIRKDVIYMYDNSDFMKETVRSTLEDTKGDKKFNFSTIGHGGGTVSSPFKDYATTLNAHDSYEGVKTEDYKSEDHLGEVSLMAHEMMHSFLGIADRPTIDIGGAMVQQELKTKPGSGRGTYDEKHMGAPIDIHEEFDAKRYIEEIRGGDLDDLSMDELMDKVDGVSVGPASLKDDSQFDDKLNDLVETIREGVDVDERKTLYMEGDLEEQYKQLLDYNITHDDYDNWQELHNDTKEQLMDRLGNFEDEADVFEGYLKHHGGEEQLKELSYDAWRSDNHLVPRDNLIQSEDDFDKNLNGIVSKVVDGVDVDSRETPYIEGDLADQYKGLLEYNLVTGDFDSYEDLSKHTKQQLKDRVGNFDDEADVFNGYLKRHGGDEQLDDLAKQTWDDSGL